MVRARRIVKKPRAKKQQEYDSDDPEAYGNEAIPDKKSSTYVEDKIDEFHNEKISKLLAQGIQEDSEQEDEDKAEEIMPLALSDSEDDEEEEEVQEEDNEEESDMESDLEGKQDDDLPNDMAWGNKKKIFYDSDYIIQKGKTIEDIDAEDKEEEEEAKKIQTRLAANLSEEDYDLNLLEEFAAEAEAEEEEVEKKGRIVKDLKTMSQKEKLKLLKKESPELLELIQDFKAKLTELRDEVQPLVEMVKDGRIPPGKGAKYLITKQQLYLNYCTNISFYLVLKAKRIPAHNHPVIERLLTYRNLINELGAVDARLAPQLRQLLSGEQQDRTLKKPASSTHIEVSEKTSLDEAKESESDEEESLRFYNAMAERQKLKRKKNEMQNEDSLVEEKKMEGDAKRRITYQMSKNKGLTPKRRKRWREMLKEGSPIRCPKTKGSHPRGRRLIGIPESSTERSSDVPRFVGRVRFVRCGVRRRDTVENGLVFVPELRGASNSSDKSTEDTHPSSNVILQWTFWCLCIGITDIMFNATAQTANEIKSSSDHSTMQNYFCIH